MQEQRRGRKIAMTPEELDAYLGSERTCTVATVSHDGPHVTALWFVWDGECVWLYSITRSQRWTDLERDPRVALLVEAGEEYNELRGVEIHGSVEPIGEVPRTGEAVRRARRARALCPREVPGRRGRRHVPRRPSRVAQGHTAQDRELGLPQARYLQRCEDSAWREIHARVR